jgi:hypothetical protein
MCLQNFEMIANGDGNFSYFHPVLFSFCILVY